MADLVVKDGVAYKRRNPWGVVGLGLVTLGVYFFVWYYKTNNHLRAYGVDNNPVLAVLAMTLGQLILVPPIVSLYKTARRIRDAQVKSGAPQRIIPFLALVLAIFVGGLALPYYQSQINKVWDAEVERGAEVYPARGEKKQLSDQ